MDLAPLTTAQSTARSAVTHENHEQAAAEYSVAADGVEDSEALRILALLESHHHQLARIIKTQSTVSTNIEPVTGGQQQQIQHSDTSLPEQTSATTPAPSPSTFSTPDTATKPRRPPSPLLQRRPMRDVSSTIASDLATARGIPSHQLRSGRHASPSSALRRADGRPAPHSDEKADRPAPISKHEASSTTRGFPQNSNARSNASPNSDYPPLPIAGQPAGPEQRHANPTGDAFNKFYSTFEGLLSKLSAPLAFAGLPLAPGEQQPDTSRSAQPPSARTKSASAAPDSPDVTRLFSKAALQAVKDDHPGFGSMQESYMVVPTAGGTVSYASILAKHDADAYNRPLPGSPSDRQEDQADHFVDAAEAPSSPHLKSKSHNPEKRQSNSTKKSLEELEAENNSLKQAIDNLSRRLYMWEKSSQTQSRALQQSIRTLQMPSQVLSEAPADAGAPPPSNTTDHARLQDLEQQLAAAKKETQRYERENEKLKTVVTRYRERWEKLKEGARVRREGAEKGGVDVFPTAVDTP